MRTTIRLNENILRKAKAYAARNGTSLTRVVEDALVEKLSGHPRRAKVTLPTDGRGGLRNSIDLDDTGDLLDRMDSEFLISFDSNVLRYAFRKDSPRHKEYSAWLTKKLQEGLQFGLAEVVLRAFVRVVPHPKIFFTPSSLSKAFEFVDAITGLPQYTPLRPASQTWVLFKLKFLRIFLPLLSVKASK